MKDLAAAGGWQQTDSLLTCYQHVDADTLLEVVTQPAPVRPIRA